MKLKKSKLAEELELIAELSFTLPTAFMLTTPALWYERLEPVEILALWLLGMVVVAGICTAISLYDESQKAKAKERGRNG